MTRWQTRHRLSNGQVLGEGARVKLTLPDAVYARSGGYGSFIVEGRYVLPAEGFPGTIEVLKEPLPPEPPVGSVVLDRDGDAWQRRRSGWYTPGAVVAETWESLNEVGPLTVIHDTGNGATAPFRTVAAAEAGS